MPSGDVGTLSGSFVSDFGGAAGFGFGFGLVAGDDVAGGGALEAGGGEEGSVGRVGCCAHDASMSAMTVPTITV
jgi:hypothetical protein